MNVARNNKKEIAGDQIRKRILKKRPGIVWELQSYMPVISKLKSINVSNRKKTTKESGK